MRFRLAVAVLLVLAGCASSPALPPGAADVILIGEQHDAPAHARVHEDWVRALAAQGRLAALALEMADQGASTSQLDARASDQQVQDALHWNEAGWPWARYGPAIMAAVRAGVRVDGANLPRARQRQVMQDGALERLLPRDALAAQQEAVRAGHCDLLPAQQVAPMTRVQIARDAAMARTVTSLAVPGKTVVLLAGAGHVRPALGVPMHLPRTLSVRAVELPAEETGRDYCEEFRKQMRG